MPMHSVRSHGHAGTFITKRLVGEGMKDKSVNPSAEGPVPLVLHGSWILLHGFRLPAVKASAATTGRPRVWAIEAASMQLKEVLKPIVLAPEFAHRDVRHRS